MVLRIILNEEAYQGMVHHALQLYKQESFGYLIGKRIKKEKSFDYTTLIKAAIPTRIYPSYNSLKQDSETYNRAISFFKNTSLGIIGDFHSHTDFSHRNGKLALSEADVENINKNGRYYFSFVIRIRESEAKNKLLTIRNNEFIHIDDFFYGKSKSKKRRLKIRTTAFYLENPRKKEDKQKVIQAEIEPSSYLQKWIDAFSKNKRRKPKQRLEDITESLDEGRPQED